MMIIDRMMFTKYQFKVAESEIDGKKKLLITLMDLLMHEEILGI
jgi:hypothetical protein